MIEFIVTSSVLIVVIIALRFLFRGRISRRLQYALWGLVLLRLLMPFPLAGSRFSVMNAVASSGIRYAATGQANDSAPADAELNPDAAFTAASSAQPALQSSLPGSGNTGLGDVRAGSPAQMSERVLSLVWLCGSAAAGVWFLGTNAAFYRRLRKSRRLFSPAGMALPVYVADHLVSPCLFGFLRPAVYLTPRTAADPSSVRYAIAHEKWHYLHGDHIWAILRGLCLAAWWWHPLVWVAAFLSRQDSELACDEAVIRLFGEDCRLSYGRTLVDMIAAGKERGGILRAATAMSAGKRGMKARLNAIVRKPKTFMSAAIAVLLIAAVCAGCTFTGAQAAESPSDSAAAASTGDTSYAQQLYNNRNPYIGNAPADGALLSLLGISKRIGNYTLELETKNEPYVLRIVFENAVTDAGALNSVMNDNAMLLLALVDNVSEIQWKYAYDDKTAGGIGQFTGALTADDASAALNGKDIKSYGKSASDVQALLDWQAAAREADAAAADQPDLDAAVSDAILSANKALFIKGDFDTEAHTSFGVIDSGSKTTVYAMAMYMVFSYSGGSLSEIGGCHIPVAITFEKNSNGDYALEEYWTPRDGSGYGPSIKAKFPAVMYSDAIDTQKYLMAHTRACYAKAVAYGHVDTEAQLKKLMETICASPAVSSNAQDYIDAHPIEYREMLYYGVSTLNYCFALFDRGGQTGLEGHIMASACRDILGDSANVDTPVTNGQEWYDAYKKASQQ